VATVSQPSSIHQLFWQKEKLSAKESAPSSLWGRRVNDKVKKKKKKRKNKKKKPAQKKKKRKEKFKAKF
jgi:hypothetical protein